MNVVLFSSSVAGVSSELTKTLTVAVTQETVMLDAAVAEAASNGIFS